MPAFCEMQKPINGFKVGDLLRGIQSSGLSSKCVLSHCLASSTVAIAHVAVSPLSQVLLPPWLSHHPSLHSRRVLDPQCWPPFHFQPSSRRSSGSPPHPRNHDAFAQQQVRPFRSIFSPLCSAITAYCFYFLITVAFTVGRGRKFKNSPATPQARGSKEF